MKSLQQSYLEHVYFSCNWMQSMQASASSFYFYFLISLTSDMNLYYLTWTLLHRIKRMHAPFYLSTLFFQTLATFLCLRNNTTISDSVISEFYLTTKWCFSDDNVLPNILHSAFTVRRLVQNQSKNLNV